MWQDLTLNFFSLENTLLAWSGRTTPVLRSRGYGHLSTSTDLIEQHSTQYDRLEIGHKSAKYLGNVYLRGNIQSSYYVGIRVVKMKLICAIIEHSDIISGFSSTSHLLKEKQKQKSCNATTFPHENTTVPGKHFYYFVIPGVLFFFWMHLHRRELQNKVWIIDDLPWCGADMKLMRNQTGGRVNLPDKYCLGWNTR